MEKLITQVTRLSMHCLPTKLWFKVEVMSIYARVEGSAVGLEGTDSGGGVPGAGVWPTWGS